MAAEADACPYPRPFPAGFDDCPTFSSQLYVPLSSRNQPMAAVRSCGFLEGGQSGTGRYYARCALGSLEDRLRWLKQMDPERLALLKTFRQALSLAVASSAEHLWALKGRQLQARRASDGEAERLATNELAAGAAEFAKVVEAFLDENQGIMGQLDLPRDATSRLIQALLDDMVIRRSANTGPVPVSPELLSRFPPEVRALFAPFEATRRPAAEGD